MLFVGDEAMLFFDLAGDRGTSLGDFAAAGLFSLLLGDLLVELDAALALQVESLDVFELLLLALLVLLRL